jgi:hypothetical protein
MGWSFPARSTVSGNADLVGIEAGAFCTVRAQTLRITGNDKLAYIRAGAFSGSVIELLYVPHGDCVVSRARGLCGGRELRPRPWRGDRAGIWRTTRRWR